MRVRSALAMWNHGRGWGLSHGPTVAQSIARRDLLELDELKLWPHQRAAIERAEVYFEAAGKQSALVNYPTGSGKTGIMAVAGRRRAQKAPVLVVCPSIALVTQLETQFRSAFWEKIGASEHWRFPHTGRLLETQLDEVLGILDDARGEAAAIFSTIQALQQIHVGPRYSELVNRFGTVFFDEGHREPAPRWALAARGIGAPTLLFSATPYRSDLKIFDVNQEFTSFLSFQVAAEKGLIRPVEVRESDLPSEPRAFARRAIEIRDELLANGQIDVMHKMIVRANEDSEVEGLFEAFVELLWKRDDGVLAIHTTFKEEGEPGAQKRGDVPSDIAGRRERFLIHQHMLTEGIDDPACTMLMLYSAFSSQRQLVQQVGRLTRHPGPMGKKALPAQVIARSNDGVLKMWNGFLDYDSVCERNGGRPPIRDRAFVEKLLAALPELDYVDGRFRRRAILGDDAIGAEIRVPLSAIVFQTKPKFDEEAFAQFVAEKLDEEDRIELSTGLVGETGCRFHLCVSFRQTPFLADSLFQTTSLEVTAYVHHKRRLYFYDTRGIWIDDYESLEPRIGPRLLGKLLPEGGEAVTALTLRNTDLGPLALRGRVLQAPSVERAGVFLGEQTYVVTRASGRPRPAVRRNLGLINGRIRDGEGPGSTLEQYADWCVKVGAELDSAAKPAALFGRFAAAIEPPAHPIPRNILIDFDSYLGVFRDSENQPVNFELEGACADILEKDGGPEGYRHAFEVTINCMTVEIWIRWEAKKSKYWLHARELSRYHDHEYPKVTLLHRLNRQQPFRIIVDTTTIYAYGRFYSIDLDLGKPGGPAALVLGLLTGVRGLEKLKSEKGTLATRAKTWPTDSLFGFIDRCLGPQKSARPMGQPFGAFVCDDLGTEVGDFIGVDEGASPRVVFIAAKWKDGKPGAGAKGLYDVSGQALKNLAYLKADGQSIPGTKTKFDQLWKLKKGSVPRRRAGPPAAEFRKRFHAVRADPSATREMWLVLAGGILSKSKLEEAFDQAYPAAHSLQLLHLLLSLYAGCTAIGVDLRIFCSS